MAFWSFFVKKDARVFFTTYGLLGQCTCSGSSATCSGATLVVVLMVVPTDYLYVLMVVVPTAYGSTYGSGACLSLIL